ncbi:sigma-70 family RNA polymerase sigma factor [Candidatus Fermentibacterales bacterium]|nr:sigma-70 family RNA polymerase sigma factor [Candidatus Fermentibacterales bacterium]
MKHLQPPQRKQFEDEVVQYLDGLYCYALHLTRNDEDACDLVQETYARAFRAYEQYQLGTNARAWLFAILRNTFLNRLRKARRNPVRTHFEEQEELSSAMEPVEPPLGTDPETETIRDEMRRDIRKALSRIPESFRSAVVLCDVEGFSYKEISSILGVPIGTVRSRIHRGRAMLQKMLEKWHDDMAEDSP